MATEHRHRVFLPSPNKHELVDEAGRRHTVPEGWEFLPAGDGPLTRRVKAAGPVWIVEIKKGRKRFSKGIWAPGEQVRDARRRLEKLRATPEHRRKLVRAATLRAKHQQEYVKQFHRAVIAWLDFHPRYQDVADHLARAVTRQATPVGSGTVARSARLPVSEKAGRAVIAWLRHNTTDYDHRSVARIKGERQRLRKIMAQESLALLASYREGREVSPSCRLLCALGLRQFP